MTDDPKTPVSPTPAPDPTPPPDPTSPAPEQPDKFRKGFDYDVPKRKKEEAGA